MSWRILCENWLCRSMVINYTSCIFLEMVENEISQKAYLGNLESFSSAAHCRNTSLSGNSLIYCVYFLWKEFSSIFHFRPGPCCDYNEVFMSWISLIRQILCTEARPLLYFKSNFFAKHLFVVNSMIPMLAIAADVFWHSFFVSLSFCPSAADITRHQVCTGGLREAVQTNHWPGFLSKENKPSRWDTFVIFWEGSLIQRLGMNVCCTSELWHTWMNSIKCICVWQHCTG